MAHGMRAACRLLSSQKVPHQACWGTRGETGDDAQCTHRWVLLLQATMIGRFS